VAARRLKAANNFFSFFGPSPLSPRPCDLQACSRKPPSALCTLCRGFLLIVTLFLHCPRPTQAPAVPARKPCGPPHRLRRALLCESEYRVDLALKRARRALRSALLPTPAATHRHSRVGGRPCFQPPPTRLLPTTSRAPNQGVSCPSCIVRQPERHPCQPRRRRIQVDAIGSCHRYVRRTRCFS